MTATSMKTMSKGKQLLSSHADVSSSTCITRISAFGAKKGLGSLFHAIFIGQGFYIFDILFFSDHGWVPLRLIQVFLSLLLHGCHLSCLNRRMHGILLDCGLSITQIMDWAARWSNFEMMVVYLDVF